MFPFSWPTHSFNVHYSNNSVNAVHRCIFHRTSGTNTYTTTWAGFDFHGPFVFKYTFFADALGLQQKIVYMFCYPKQKTARECTSGRESNTEPGNRRWGVKYNDLPSIQSHLGLLSRIIIQKENERWNGSLIWIIIICLFFPSLTVSSQASDHGPFFSFNLLFVKPPESELYTPTIHVEIKNTIRFIFFSEAYRLETRPHKNTQKPHASHLRLDVHQHFIVSPSKNTVREREREREAE